VVGLFASASQLLHLDAYFQEIPNQFAFTIRFFSLVDYLYWIPYLVPIGFLLPMTFPKGCRTLRRILVIVFAGSLLVALLQYKIDPGSFRILLAVANMVWATLGFKIYEYSRKLQGEKVLDGMTE
jgi:glycopeptide antibiotics resistance protein